LNGREWLRRLLDKNDVKYVLGGNKSLDIGDYGRAQELLSSQLDARWVEMLSGFLPDVFPTMPTV